MAKDDYHIHFNHVSEIADFIDEKGKLGMGSGGFNPSHNMYARKTAWCGNSTLSDAMKLAATGWHVGTDDILNKLDAIKHDETMEQRGYQWDVVGQQFDIGAVLSGEPECWLKEDYQPTRKFVSICINLSLSGGISENALTRRGAAVIALVDKLQDEGYIVELKAVQGIDCLFTPPNGTGKHHYHWLNFGMSPLDLDEASFVLAHPAFFRQMGFALMDITTQHSECASNCYCKDIPAEMQKQFNVYIPTGDLRNKNGNDINNEADCAKWVQEVIDGLRGEEHQKAIYE